MELNPSPNSTWIRPPAPDGGAPKAPKRRLDFLIPLVLGEAYGWRHVAGAVLLIAAIEGGRRAKARAASLRDPAFSSRE